MPYRTLQLTLLRLSAQAIISWAVFDELLQGACLAERRPCQVCGSVSDILADTRTAWAPCVWPPSVWKCVRLVRELSSLRHCPCHGHVRKLCYRRISGRASPTPSTGRRPALPQTRGLGLGGPWALWEDACPGPSTAGLIRRGDTKNLPQGAAHTVRRSTKRSRGLADCEFPIC